MPDPPDKLPARKSPRKSKQSKKSDITVGAFLQRHWFGMGLAVVVFIWEAGVNVGLQKGYFDSTPDVAVFLMFVVPVFGLLVLALWHPEVRKRYYLLKTHPFKTATSGCALVGALIVLTFCFWNVTHSASKKAESRSPKLLVFCNVSTTNKALGRIVWLTNNFLNFKPGFTNVPIVFMPIVWGKPVTLDMWLINAGDAPAKSFSAFAEFMRFLPSTALANVGFLPHPEWKPVETNEPVIKFATGRELTLLTQHVTQLPPITWFPTNQPFFVDQMKLNVATDGSELELFFSVMGVRVSPEMEKKGEAVPFTVEFFPYDGLPELLREHGFR